MKLSLNQCLAAVCVVSWPLADELPAPNNRTIYLLHAPALPQS